ncbi:MAG: D-glycero-beta-D-manno-heptose-7-phosphate kinase [Hydrogenophilales bacterium 16-64-46]|nr:MAG: D-glycero-beta-D-manno-heptose-7-phosphate kinase [Hydrogenophilales bacterium 12-64-13]OYZ04189.1 MAG: D-glycero-beta-D-manno-heptose-7-phosphate kinase [Hydrogenophilales bacterium 16-64-46]OZA36894.1 MAG: D-glycero-beta-D-manno-heptose-7-phosphate kinase [Hydrogenophilales bacterium 17-64-34]HQS99986.1 D-glycero-beta-D-manno-heptose-7-phosphate kinase [Thiobacillus sp.]
MTLRDDIRRARILVVGDVMLDRYWFGEVSRISPEAPVPVVHVKRNEDRIGGAGNVARNAAALGAQVTLLSVAGKDEAGQALRGLLEKEPFEVHLHEDPAFSTITKLRVIGRQQQLLRVDFETPPSHEILAAKLEAYLGLLPACDAVILSDYGKGGLTHVVRMIELARAAGKPILVDPKGDDWIRYAGATLITPNRSEFRDVAGSWKSELELANKAAAVCAEFGIDALLLTRSEEGMSLFDARGAHHEATQAREVYDVSGAGDTVIAAMATALAAGMDGVEAMRLANRAAGIVVGKFGTAVASAKEVFGETA